MISAENAHSYTRNVGSGREGQFKFRVDVCPVSARERWLELPASVVKWYY